MSDSSASGPRKHPGKGKKRPRPRPKGRQVVPEAAEDVRRLLGERSRAPQLLIEHLHRMQDHFGYLSAAHLAALAAEMKMALAEVYEVATFYAHFDVVKEGETPPPPVTVRVCDSLTCELMGAQSLLTGLASRVDASRVRITRGPCMGRCDTAPVAQVGQWHAEGATVEAVQGAIGAERHEPEVSAYIRYREYVRAGGYKLLRDCLKGRYTRHAVIKELQSSELRGLGGAGFPAWRKWELVRAEPRPRLFALNADEGEPGTFKDRYYLERDPHRVLEGMLIACWAIEAEVAYIYLRDEYPGVRRILQQEIRALEKAGIGPKGYIRLRRGAGAYICGEESAMLESIEGKRGLPRHRPPYPAQVGLFGRPTLIHNVETMYWVRDIVQRGGTWFAGQGRHGSKGLRSFSVSGRVAEPGVKIAPAGITVRELIDEFCGGMAPGHVLKAYLPGGASGGILPASAADVPLDFGGKLAELGCFVGSHAIVVLSQQDSAAAAARNLLRFFEDESCGQCTPCRLGCEKALQLMEADSWDESLLRELSAAMADASICGLGQAAPNPVLSVLQHFPGEAGSAS